MRAAVIVALLPLAVSIPLKAQNSCRLVGVWELVSGKADTASYPANLRQWKIITRTHWAFIARTDSIVREMKTAADTEQVLRSNSAGGGTYTLQGTTYTEHIQFFPDPAYIGMSLPFTCRTEGDRFIQTGTFPELQGGKTVHTWRLEEVYRRIE